MAKKRLGKRTAGLKSPYIFIPAFLCLLVVAIALTFGIAAKRSEIPLPAQTKTYDAFVDEVRGGQVASVATYQGKLLVTNKDGSGYYTADAFPFYSVELLRQQRVTITARETEARNYSLLGVGIVLALILPYTLLGWIIFAMARSVSECGTIEDFDNEQTKLCGHCQEPTLTAACFCHHCGSRVQ